MIRPTVSGEMTMSAHGGEICLFIMRSLVRYADVTRTVPATSDDKTDPTYWSAHKVLHNFACEDQSL